MTAQCRVSWVALTSQLHLSLHPQLASPQCSSTMTIDVGCVGKCSLNSKRPLVKHVTHSQFGSVEK
ncbi:hypothetical protein CALCODRAFT_77185 [Calocera cornea HHB12733]|uniref:Uncharacterized protein n=1 Tax=Calocera cornea HHB12733 TaxID=1353952 RepID=A0A165DHN1_9BASI|nr:hypothetical protein CALCODRAFT_77185 [Calocera cornea HHB12733]